MQDWLGYIARREVQNSEVCESVGFWKNRGPVDLLNCVVGADFSCLFTLGSGGSFTAYFGVISEGSGQNGITCRR